MRSLQTRTTGRVIVGRACAALALSALCFASGCGGETAKSQDRAKVEPKQDKYSGEPSVGKRALEVGETRKGKKVETTIVKVQDNLSPKGLEIPDFLNSEGGDRWFGIYVKTCVVGTLKADEAFTTWPNDYKIGTSEGITFNTPDSYEDWPSPRYPTDEAITTGCREGWVNFALKDKDKPDRAIANDGDSGLAYAEWLF